MYTPFHQTIDRSRVRFTAVAAWPDELVEELEFSTNSFLVSSVRDGPKRRKVTPPAHFRRLYENALRAERQDLALIGKECPLGPGVEGSRSHVNFTPLSSLDLQTSRRLNIDEGNPFEGCTDESLPGYQTPPTTRDSSPLLPTKVNRFESPAKPPSCKKRIVF